jgi:hypothetical protein
MKNLLCLIGLLALTGCSNARIGTAAAGVSIPNYPGARVVSNGENGSIIGANLTTTDPMPKVEQYYAGQLGVAPAGSMHGTKNGHQINVIVSDAGAGAGKTAVAITELK